MLTIIRNSIILKYFDKITSLSTKISKLAIVVEGDPKAPFSTTTTPRCSEECDSFPWIAPLYPWYVPYIAEY